MASIIKRGNKFRAQISLYKYGQHDKLTKTFETREEAKRWALSMELEKGNGKQLAKRTTPYTVFFENWINIVKKNEVREVTFQNYETALIIIKRLFKNIQLKDLNDILVQKKIDEYAKNRSRKTVNTLLLKIKSSLRDAFARGYLTNDFAGLIKVRGFEPPKRNKALSITDFKTLRKYLIENSEKEFNVLVLIALETGMRRGELLGIRPEDLYECGIKVRRSISPTSSDIRLKNPKTKRDISITEEVYTILKNMPVKKSGYIFDPNGFKQSERLAELLNKIGLPKTTFHGLRDTHASYLFSQNIDIVYVSQRLGHSSIATTQNYYIELMPEKKHQQDADALNLLNSLSH